MYCTSNHKLLYEVTQNASEFCIVVTPNSHIRLDVCGEDFNILDILVKFHIHALQLKNIRQTAEYTHQAVTPKRTNPFYIGTLEDRQVDSIKTKSL